MTFFYIYCQKWQKDGKHRERAEDCKQGGGKTREHTTWSLRIFLGPSSFMCVAVTLSNASVYLDKTDSNDHLSPPEQQSSGPSRPLNTSEDNRPFLPPEILDRIVKETMRIDGAMLHTFNRVSSGFKAITAAHLPWLYFRPEVAKELELDERHDKHICVKAIIKEAGKGSGLFFKLKELFGKNKMWRMAWLTMHHEKFGRYTVKDIFWWIPWQNVPLARPQEIAPRCLSQGKKSRRSPRYSALRGSQNIVDRRARLAILDN